MPTLWIVAINCNIYVFLRISAHFVKVTALVHVGVMNEQFNNGMLRMWL